MLGRLILLFTIVPLVELYLLIKVGSYLGALNTVFLVVSTGILGALLARMEGLRILQQIMRTFAQGAMPTEELMDGVLIFVAGALLVTPGILTDLVGLFFLIPQTRAIFKRWVKKKLERMATSGRLQIHFRGGRWNRF